MNQFKFQPACGVDTKNCGLTLNVHSSQEVNDSGNVVTVSEDIRLEDAPFVVKIRGVEAFWLPKD